MTSESNNNVQDSAASQNESQKNIKTDSLKNKIDRAIVTATGGVLLGTALSSIGLPVALTGAIIGAIAGAAIGFSVNKASIEIE